MNNLKKIIFNLILMICIPLCTYATDGVFQYEYTYNDSDENNIIAQATITGYTMGDNTVVNIPSTVDFEGVTYNVTTIAGNAFSNKTNITEVNIPEGITSIGHGAFWSCTGLTSIEIPESVTSIGGNAFEDTPWLTNKRKENALVIVNNILIDGKKFEGEVKIELLNGVTSICDRAFEGCTGLNSIEIPEGVTEIGDRAFYGCSNLIEVTIPTTLETVGYLQEMPYNGVFNGSGSNLQITFRKLEYIDEKGETVTKQIKKIPAYLFYNANNIKNITIPKSVITIGMNAFNGCTGLNSIEIPEGVTEIGDRAFYGCSNLIEVTLPTTLTTVTHPYGNLSGVFKGSGSNLQITFRKLEYIDEKGETVTKQIKKIPAYLFYNANNIKNITIPKSVITIGMNAFDGCTGLKSIEIPDSVTTIEEYAFYGCTGLTSIEIPDSVTTIEDSTFLRCTGLTSINIPNGVTTIGDHAFDGCMKLTNVSIGTGVELIGKSSFARCVLLEEITIPGNVKTIGRGAFVECTGLQKVIMLEGVENIGECVFLDCYNLSKVTIPTTLIRVQNEGDTYNYSTDIFKNAGKNCTDGLKIEFGVAYVQNGEETIQTHIEKIPAYLFSGANYIKSIILPDSVVSIEERAFCYCENLKEIEMPTKLNFLGYEAFANCNSLTAIKVPSTESIDYYVFAECENLERVVLEEGTQYIGHGMFIECKKLSNVTIPNTVTDIYTSAFLGCENLSKITFPDSVTDIGMCAFYGCINLTNVFFNNIEEIDNLAFYGCKSLSEAIFLSNTNWNYPRIMVNAFGNCSNNFKLIIVDNDFSISTEILGMSNVNATIFGRIQDDNGNIKETNKKVYGEILKNTQSEISNFTEIVTAYQGETVKDTIDRGGFSNIYIQAKEIETLSGEYTLNDEYKTSLGVTDFELGVLEKDFSELGIETIYTNTGIEMKLIVVEGETYTIKYNPGTQGDFEEQEYEKKYGEEMPEFEGEPIGKENYIFIGWKSSTTGEILSELPEIVTENVTYTAQWESKKTYTLTYKVDGEIYGEIESYEYGANITPREEPTKEGYTFSGWSEIPETMPAENVEITGSFNKNTYTLTYKVDGEIYGEIENYEYGANIISRTEPTKQGYTFSGWSEIPETMPAENVEVEGTFSIITYTISYELNEGVMSEGVENPTTYTIEDEITLNNPTKEGYTFTGWTGSNGETPETEMVIEKGTTGNLSYTANWTEIEQEKELYIRSKVYEIGEVYILKIQPETTIAEFYNNIETNYDIKKVYLNKEQKENKIELKADELITTGSILELDDKLGHLELILVVEGDINRDGYADIQDLSIMKEQLVQFETTLQEDQYLAADINYDKEFDIVDLANLKWRLVQ